MVNILKVFNPRSFIEESFLGDKWYLSIIISSSAFILYFIQVFLDINQTYNTSFSLKVLVVIFMGFLFGSVGIVLVGFISWLLSKIFRGEMGLSEMIGSFALGYSNTLIFMTMGLGINLALGWNTSLSFGVTGVLWAFMPMTLVIRKSVKGRTIPTVVITTICGMLITLGFGLIHLI